METPKPVVGHHAAWGLSSSNKYRVEPYKLTPGSTDTMCVRVREKIDIKGVGCDVVDMEGIFTVRRDHPCAEDGGSPEWGKSCIKTEFRSLELYGQSPLFGTVRVHLDPEHSSNGEVGPGENGSLAAKCVAHCYPTIELPELGMKLTTNGKPIRLASKVVQIPPVGDVARSENSADLVDDSGELVGEIISSDIEVGEIICSTPLGGTGTFESGVHTGHDTGEHIMPSGPSFYAGLKGVPVTTAGSGGHVHDHGTNTGSNTASTVPGEVLNVLAQLQKELGGLISELRQQTKK